MIVRQLLQVAAKYASLGCSFGRTLERAAPNLFTFLLHPGMEPTNNLAERSQAVLMEVVQHTAKSRNNLAM